VFVGVEVAVLVGVLVGVFVGGVVLTVLVSVLEVTLLTVAEAMFVTEPAVTSLARIVYVAVHVILSPTSSQSSPSPTVLTAGHVTVVLLSETVTGPSRDAYPLFVTR
jgi:predicted lysophospholipase L1 biosynthesis ABC-type transport system permease subunit